MLKHLCIPGINPAWSWYMICLLWFTCILLRIFTSVFTRDICITIILVSRNDLEMFPPLQLFGSFRKDWCQNFKCLIDFFSEVIWYWVFLCEIFSFNYLFNLLIGLIIFLYDSILIDCMFIKIYLILIVILSVVMPPQVLKLIISC